MRETAAAQAQSAQKAADPSAENKERDLGPASAVKAPVQLEAWSTPAAFPTARMSLLPPRTPFPCIDCRRGKKHCVGVDGRKVSVPSAD